MITEQQQQLGMLYYALARAGIGVSFEYPTREVSWSPGMMYKERELTGETILTLEDRDGGVLARISSKSLPVFVGQPGVPELTVPSQEIEKHIWRPEPTGNDQKADPSCN